MKTESWNLNVSAIMMDSLLSEIFIILLALIILFVFLLIWLSKIISKHRKFNDLLESANELSSMFNDRISPDLTKILQFVEFQRSFQVSQQQAFERKTMQKFDALDDRLDELLKEVVTQQVTRHKLNDMIAAKTKSDPE